MVRTRKDCVPTNWVLMPSIHRLRKVIRPSKEAHAGKIGGLGRLRVPSLQTVSNVPIISGGLFVA